MKILFYDVIQNAALPPEASAVKSSSLADAYIFDDDNPLRICFDKPVIINCIGIGNFSNDALTFIMEIAYINGGSADTENFTRTADGGSADTAHDNDYQYVPLTVTFNKDGLYPLNKNYETLSITVISPAGSSVGRIAAGKAVDIPTAVAKEPCFNSTSEPRRTLSGQVIPGAGGYNYMSVSLDSRYKIGKEAIDEIKAGYKAIGAGVPFFIDLSAESYKLPFDKLYAAETNQRQMSFEGGIRRYLYSRRWNFEEAF